MSASTKANGNNSNKDDDDDDERKPGAGWSNGDVPPQLYPSTRDGQLALYSQQRRWIGLNEGWSRLGDGGHEHDAVTSTSFHGKELIGNNNNNTTSNDKGTEEVVLQQRMDEQALAVRSLIAQLCETFYKAGWATGTGGGCSIRVPTPTTTTVARSNTTNTNTPATTAWRVFVAPSGIQKEDMIGDDIFELDMDRNVVHPPRTVGLRQSACTPLWYVVYHHRPTAACVIHTHSLNAVQATLLDPYETSTCLRLTHLEMLKGVGNHAYDDVLEVPIIDNRPTEDLLADQLAAAIVRYPQCNAVLVRRHGLYCWGDSWEQAKTQCESFDYLFECAVKLKQLGVDPAAPPRAGSYRHEEDAITKESLPEEETAHGTKKRKMATTNNGSAGFNGQVGSDNRSDCLSNSTPLLPRDEQYKFLLIDVEGCTTSIAFVKEVLFPYCREQLYFYFDDQDEDELARHVMSLEVERSNAGVPVPASEKLFDMLVELAKSMMDHDVKAPYLKMLQGKIWEIGYDLGEIQGHVYPDFLPLLQWLKANGNVKVYIYSSGSVQAQKLLFGHSLAGDLLPWILGHFDILTAGPKKEAKSYQNIASALGTDVSNIVFVSDSIGELEAATAAGIGAAVMSIRPGNAPLTATELQTYPTVHSLLQLCGC